MEEINDMILSNIVDATDLSETTDENYNFIKKKFKCLYNFSDYVNKVGIKKSLYTEKTITENGYYTIEFMGHTITNLKITGGKYKYNLKFGQKNILNNTNLDLSNIIFDLVHTSYCYINLYFKDIEDDPIYISYNINWLNELDRNYYFINDITDELTIQHTNRSIYKINKDKISICPYEKNKQPVEKYKAYDFIDFMYKLENRLIEDFYYMKEIIPYGYENVSHLIISETNEIVKDNIYRVIHKGEIVKNIKLEGLNGREVHFICGDIFLFSVRGKDTIDLSDITFSLINLQFNNLIFYTSNTEQQPYTIKYTEYWLDNDNKHFLLYNNFVFYFGEKMYIYCGGFLRETNLNNVEVSFVRPDIQIDDPDKWHSMYRKYINAVPEMSEYINDAIYHPFAQRTNQMHELYKFKKSNGDADAVQYKVIYE